jgi:hypothetical protein
MNWPSNSGMSSEVEQLLNNRLKHFLDANSDEHGGEDGIEVQRLIIDLYVIYKSAESPFEKVRLQQEIIQRGSLWDTDDPVLAQIQKYVNRICVGQYIAGTDYLDKAIAFNEKLKATGAAQTIQKNGRDGAGKKHVKTNQILEQAKQYYLDNRAQFWSQKQAAIELSEKFPPIKPGTYTNKLKKWKQL